MRRPFLLLILLALPGVTSHADAVEVDVSFPLGEHYRPGRYLPVRISAKKVGEATPVRIEVAGAVPTEVLPTGGAVDAVVPLLAVTTLKDAKWSAGGAGGLIARAFRPLADDERLVGIAGGEGDPEAFVSKQFPGMKLIAVPLDLASPLAGPAMAWGALDAVLLDAAAAARVTEPQLGTLLASGTAVAVRADVKPGGDVPWQRRGEWWVSAPQLAGPGGLIEPVAYEPVAAWNPGWPASRRRAIVLTLLAFAIVAIAMTLWRSRFAPLAVVGVSLVALGGLAAWRAGGPSTATATGAVRVNDAWTQHDTWTFHRGLAAGDGVEHVSGVGRPVFASRRHFEGTRVTLMAGADGSHSFRYRLEPGRTLAFVHRRVERRVAGGNVRTTVASPLRPLAQSLYLRRGDALLIGATAHVPEPVPDDYEFWRVVVIERFIPPAATAPAPVRAVEAPPG